MFNREAGMMSWLELGFVFSEQKVLMTRGLEGHQKGIKQV